MNAGLHIRKADLPDAPILEKVSKETFIETFAAQNTKEDMDLFLTACFNLDAIKSEISDVKTGYYMAFLNNELAGYVKVRKAGDAGIPQLNCLEIARIYVYEKFQNKKIGAALMQFAVDLAKNENLEVIWLGVWEHNPKAIEFYIRWGFEVFGEHVFKLGTDLQNDLLMKKELK
jgi:ribosomal protein S18 acetylase RimI-like enzyme